MIRWSLLEPIVAWLSISTSMIPTTIIIISISIETFFLQNSTEFFLQHLHFNRKNYSVLLYASFLIMLKNEVLLKKILNVR